MELNIIISEFVPINYFFNYKIELEYPDGYPFDPPIPFINTNIGKQSYSVWCNDIKNTINKRKLDIFEDMKLIFLKILI